MESDRKINVWYDSEGDYLEVNFSRAPGTFEETENDQVMVKLNEDGEVLGFSILAVSRLGGKPLDVALSAAE